jgi:PilZ domain
MQSASSPARQARSHYRHELRTLTYVTLDEANGGVIRNLNHEGMSIQAVAALRHEQRVRLRFELRFPRLRVDAYGQVSWSKPSGQCGIRFTDLSPRLSSQIDQWIFSNLLDSVARETTHSRSIFEDSVISISQQGREAEQIDGLTLSAPPHPVIELEPRVISNEAGVPLIEMEEESFEQTYVGLNWLSRPISAKSLAWLVDGLVVIAALLLFVLTFLTIARELPEWPVTLAAVAAAAVFVVVAYWSLFVVFGGPSLGARLARATSGLDHDDECGEEDRFR